MANLLTAAGVDRVLTMDLHAAQIQGFFDIPVDHLYAAPVLIRHLREHYVKDLNNLVVVSPDVGGVKMARAYSDALGAEPGHRRQAPLQRHACGSHERDRRGGRAGRRPD